ncbi:MAG: hypothetical protein IJP54_03095, partial [Synergistaceae bacterium]|nr:hypothetical protein [Synergistaceae bacterium]
DAEVNVHDIEVKQLATAQTNRSNQITASTIASTLSSGGVTGTSSTMYITAGGQRIGIDVYSTDSLQSLKSRINNTIKTLASPLDVTASVVDNRLVIRSDYTGLGTKTVEGTVRGGYNSNGITSLTGLLTNSESTETFDIAVSEDNAENLKVMSGGTTYVNGTDYVVVNGTEIRWKQYDRGNEVALGDYVNARYTMAAGDVYTASGTVGDDEAMIFGFTMTDNGTLASRVKIVDEDGTTYTYGDDFTITNAKVSWLEKDTSAATNEPSSYTVSYSKDVAVSSSTGITRGAGSDDAISSTDFSALEAAYRKAYSLDDDKDLPTVTISAGNVLRTYLDPADKSAFTMTDSSGKTYEYGKDYVIRVNDTGDGWTVSWALSGSSNISDANPDVTAYMEKKGITTYGMQQAPASGTSTLTFSKDVTVTDSGTVSSSDDDKSLASILEDVTVTSGDYRNSITIKNGSTTYTYGKDYTIDSDGNIEWLKRADMTAEPSSYTVNYTDVNTVLKDFTYSSSERTKFDVTGIADSLADFENLQGVSYYTSSEGARIYTFDDSNELSLSVGGTEYVYGRDYVIRSSTSYNGSKTQLFIETSGTYLTQYQTMLQDDGGTVPDGTKQTGLINGINSAELSFAHTTKYDNSADSAEITSLLSNEDTRDSVIITLSDGSVCTQGVDYTISDDGTINWIIHNQPNKGKSYTLYYEAFSAMEATASYSAGNETTALSDFSGANLTYTDILKDNNVSTKRSSESDDDYQDRIDTALAEVFSLSDGTNTYEYGTDYRIIADSDGAPVISWVDTGN